jgi:hypothetical protein
MHARHAAVVCRAADAELKGDRPDVDPLTAQVPVHRRGDAAPGSSSSSPSPQPTVQRQLLVAARRRRPALAEPIERNDRLGGALRHGVTRAAWIAAAALAAFATAGPASANPIQAENALPGGSGWNVAAPEPGAIEGFASQISVAPGDRLDLHVNAESGSRYRVEVWRIGWYGGAGGRLVACAPACGGDRPAVDQPATPPPDPQTGAVAPPWTTTDSLPVGFDWTTGYYEAKFVETSGAHPDAATAFPFVVRSPEGGRTAPILVQASVNTWEAYNGWGGRSLYDFNSVGGVPATHVSFLRPFKSPGPSSSFPATHEWPLVRFLEQAGSDVDYAADLDADRDPTELLRHRLAIVAGHGEYWSKGERDAFEAARNGGTNLAFLGANTAYWQVRYEDDRTTVVGYKSAPDPEPDPALRTVKFRDLVPARPECELLGVQYHYGAHSRTGDAPRDLVVTAPADDPWLRGTGLDYRTFVPDLVRPEWDATVPRCRVPAPEVLLRYVGLFSPRPVTPGVEEEPGARQVHRVPDAEAVRYTAPSGARVFAAGALMLSTALDPWAPSPPPGWLGLRRFIGKAIDDLTRPPVAQGVRALPLAGAGPARPVTVYFRAPTDLRVQAVRVLRRAGAASFGPGARGAVTVCASATSPCTDPAPPPRGVFRYAVVADDGQRTSPPAMSAAVTMQGPRIALAHAPRGCLGPATARPGLTLSGSFGLRLVTVWLDRRVLRRSRRHQLRLQLPTRRLRRGSHVLRVQASDRLGNVSVQGRRFRACGTTG